MFLFKLALWQQLLIAVIIALILSTKIFTDFRHTPFSPLLQLVNLTAIGLLQVNTVWMLIILTRYYPSLNSGFGLLVLFVGLVTAQFAFGVLSAPYVDKMLSH